MTVFLFLWESEREELPSEWEKMKKKRLQAVTELYMPRLFLFVIEGGYLLLFLLLRKHVVECHMGSTFTSLPNVSPIVLLVFCVFVTCFSKCLYTMDVQ